MLIVGNIFILMCYSRFGSGISCFFLCHLLYTNFPFNYGEWWVRSDCVGNWCIREKFEVCFFYTSLRGKSPLTTSLGGV